MLMMSFLCVDDIIIACVCVCVCVCRSDVKSKIKEYNLYKNSPVDKLKSREVRAILILVCVCCEEASSVVMT